MKTKEFKITIPEGYEIDKENSTFECIKFKPITALTYEDIAESLFKNKSIFFTSSDGVIMSVVDENDAFSDPNNTANKKQLERLLAMNQLLNIAEYYNQKREKTPSGYIILRGGGELYATGVFKDSMSLQAPFFYSREDAVSVIYNPNFKELLDLVYL